MLLEAVRCWGWYGHPGSVQASLGKMRRGRSVTAVFIVVLLCLKECLKREWDKNFGRQVAGTGRKSVTPCGMFVASMNEQRTRLDSQFLTSGGHMYQILPKFSTGVAWRYQVLSESKEMRLCISYAL